MLNRVIAQQLHGKACVLPTTPARLKSEECERSLDGSASSFGFGGTISNIVLLTNSVLTTSTCELEDSQRSLELYCGLHTGPRIP